MAGERQKRLINLEIPLQSVIDHVDYRYEEC